VNVGYHIPPYSESPLDNGSVSLITYSSKLRKRRIDVDIS